MNEKANLSEYFIEISEAYELSLSSLKPIEIPLARGNNDNDDLKLFRIVREEIFNFLCKEKDKYTELKKDIKNNWDKIFNFLCGAVAASIIDAGISIPVAILSAAVAILLKITLNIGLQSLCKYASMYSLDENRPLE